MKKFKIGFIGTGNIATAIINGVISSGYIKPDCIAVFDTNSDKLAPFVNFGCESISNSAELTDQCEFVFLTVKPQIYPVVLNEIKNSSKDTCFVDVAAGVSINAVKGLLGFNAPVIRVMPNTPLMVGLGATAIVKQDPVTDDQFSFIKGCFDSCGITAVVDEENINIVIAASGSSPAYIMRFANSIIDFAVSNGLDNDSAKQLVIQTLEGCAKLVKESDVGISQLIANVTSPNGTTEAGLKSLDESSFENVIDKCLKATVKRAEELSK